MQRHCHNYIRFQHTELFFQCQYSTIKHNSNADVCLVLCTTEVKVNKYKNINSLAQKKKDVAGDDRFQQIFGAREASRGSWNLNTWKSVWTSSNLKNIPVACYYYQSSGISMVVVKTLETMCDNWNLNVDLTAIFLLSLWSSNYKFSPDVVED